MTELGPAAYRLLRVVAEHDQGDGVTFEPTGDGRWRLPESPYSASTRIFIVLANRGLIDVGEIDTDPVRATGAGRAYLDPNGTP